jgi:hypothetical protein
MPLVPVNGFCAVGDRGVSTPGSKVAQRQSNHFEWERIRDNCAQGEKYVKFRRLQLVATRTEFKYSLVSSSAPLSCVCLIIVTMETAA